MSTVWVFTMSGGKGKWSYYAFPFAIEAFAQLGNTLYMRHGNTVSRVVEGIATDEVDGVQVPFGGRAQWPWVDAGQTGATKMMKGFDLVATGLPAVSVGYDERNPNAFTAPYAIDPDTLPGGLIPLPVMGPSFSLRIDFEPGTRWSLKSAALQLIDTMGQP